MKFHLQCKQRMPLFPTNHLFPVGALLGEHRDSFLAY